MSCGNDMTVSSSVRAKEQVARLQFIASSAALASDGKTFVVMFDLPGVGIYYASRRPGHDRPNNISLSNPGAARRRWDGRGLQSRGLHPRPFRRFEIPS